jgi:hypothetical protein
MRKDLLDKAEAKEEVLNLAAKGSELNQVSGTNNSRNRKRKCARSKPKNRHLWTLWEQVQISFWSQLHLKFGRCFRKNGKYCVFG